jgi:hypothetical protein
MELAEAEKRLAVAREQRDELDRYIEQLELYVTHIRKVRPPDPPQIGRFSRTKTSLEIFTALINENGPSLHDRLIDLALEGGARFGSPRSSQQQVRGAAWKAIDGLIREKKLRRLHDGKVDTIRK